jgi:hypothetical protein
VQKKEIPRSCTMPLFILDRLFGNYEYELKYKLDVYVGQVRDCFGFIVLDIMGTVYASNKFNCIAHGAIRGSSGGLYAEMYHRSSYIES